MLHTLVTLACHDSFKFQKSYNSGDYYSISLPYYSLPLLNVVNSLLLLIIIINDHETFDFIDTSKFGSIHIWLLLMNPNANCMQCKNKYHNNYNGICSSKTGMVSPCYGTIPCKFLNSVLAQMIQCFRAMVLYWL